MDDISVVETMLAVILALIAWWALQTWGRLKILEDSQRLIELKLASDYRTIQEGDAIKQDLVDKIDRIGNMELLLAQNYVTKQELKDLFGDFNIKLDMIRETLAEKANKS